jgi:hypothetical protein
MTPDQYRCPRCGDEMAPRFICTHEPICAWRAPIDARDIETFLLEMFP